MQKRKTHIHQSEYLLYNMTALTKVGPLFLRLKYFQIKYTILGNYCKGNLPSWSWVNRLDNLLLKDVIHDEDLANPWEILCIATFLLYDTYQVPYNRRRKYAKILPEQKYSSVHVLLHCNPL